MASHQGGRQGLRSRARAMILESVPGRYRLSAEILLERLTGRLEEELSILGTLTASRGVAVDIGANRGYYSYYLSRIFAEVVAFEPNAALTGNLARCGAANITIHHCALSSADGALQLNVPSRDGRLCDGWASVERLQPSDWDAIAVTTVPGRRLDDFALRNVSLIKIDVEGHEVATLEGSLRTLEANRPVVIIEVKEANREPVAALFDRLALVPHVVSSRRLERLDEGLVRYTGPKDTFVFVPEPWPAVSSAK